MKPGLYLFIAWMISISFAFSQQTHTEGTGEAGYSIKGIVVDSLDKLPVEFAAVALYNLKDSSLVTGVTTGEKGIFEMNNLKPASYYLAISFIGYETYYHTIPEKQFTSPMINLGRLNMSLAGFEIAEIQVSASRPDVFQKGDTAVYNADAFIIEENAMIEDLISQLPGVEYDPDEGTIVSSTGNEVKRIFVDGEEAFADEPDLILKNYPADMVHQMEIFERKTDEAIRTGIDDGVRETVINIITKSGVTTMGWMGTIKAGAGGLIDNPMGEGPRYNGSANITRMVGKDRYTFMANANNVNGRNADNIRGKIGGRGLSTSGVYGVNVNKYVGEIWKINGDVKYSNNNQQTDQSRFRQNIFTDSVSYRSTVSKNENSTNKFSLNSTIEFTPDTFTTVVFKPVFSYGHSSTNSASTQETRAGDIDSTLVNSSKSVNRSSSNDYSLRLQMDFSRKLSEKGRQLSLGAVFGLNNRDEDTRKDSENKFYKNPDRNRTENQQKWGDNKGQNYSLYFGYVEPLGKNNYLNLSYRVDRNNSDNENRTLDYDPLTDDFSILNGNYSRNSETRHTKQSVRLNFTSEQEKFNYNIGVNVAPTNRSSITYIKDWHGVGNDSILNAPPAAVTVNYAPQLIFNYRFRTDSIRRKLQFRYNGHTSQPSVSQLDPTPNNNDPLYIRSGNPDLLPSFENKLYMEYLDNNSVTQRNFKASVSYEFTRNQIINYSIYEAETGIQYTYPVNRSGAWNGAINIFYSKPLDEDKKYRLSSQSRINYRKQLGYMNVNKQSEENDSKNTELTETVIFNYQLEKHKGEMKLNLRYSENHYTLNKENKRDYFNCGFTYKPYVRFTEEWSLFNEFNFRYTETHYSINNNDSYTCDVSIRPVLNMPYGWAISHEFRYSGKRGMSAGYDTNEKIWNALLSKKILNNKGMILLQVNDILQESVNVSRNVMTDYFEDTEFTALTSYFMISFNYQFNHIKTFTPKNKSIAGLEGIVN